MKTIRVRYVLTLVCQSTLLVTRGVSSACGSLTSSITEASTSGFSNPTYRSKKQTLKSQLLRRSSSVTSVINLCRSIKKELCFCIHSISKMISQPSLSVKTLKSVISSLWIPMQQLLQHWALPTKLWVLLTAWLVKFWCRAKLRATCFR